MKKILILFLAAFAVCMTSCDRNKKTNNQVKTNSSVEELIKQDQAYFANMAGKISFFESRIVMPKAFNESDKFVAQSVTNVFQQTIDNKDGGFETTVYFFTHQLNDCNTDIDIHKGAFVLSDKPLVTDSLPVSFAEAFVNARMSNYKPSRSRYITLRHVVGPKSCNAFYVIGNDDYGLLCVDAVTGKVSDKMINE